MKCIQLVNENPVILRCRTDYYWVSFVFSKLFALKDKILSLNPGFKSVPKIILGIDTSSSAIDITEITTQSLIGNGQTLVLGGIFQSEELSDIEEVPVLGDIPLLGNLFKKQMRAKDKREILIFITPKIIDEKFLDT